MSVYADGERGVCSSGFLADLYCLATGDVVGANTADAIHGAIGAPLNQLNPINRPQPIHRPRPTTPSRPVYRPQPIMASQPMVQTMPMFLPAMFTPQPLLGNVCGTPTGQCIVNVATVGAACGCLGIYGTSLGSVLR
jgi:hypothetical protein